jgi:lambda family phage tail tape measure protein
MDNRASTDDLRTAQNAVNIAVEQYGTPAVLALADAFSRLAPQIDAATQSAAGFRAEASVMPSLGQLSPLFSEGGKIFSGEDFAPADPPTPSRRPLIELEGLPKVGGGRTKRAKQSGYETATASVSEQTRALQAQTAAQATLNPLVTDYGFAVAKAKVETDLLLAAEKDKRAITPELTAQISAQAESYAQAVVEQNKLTEATKKATEAVNFVKNTTAGFINDLRDGLKNGESFWESFSNAALNVLDRITDKLLNDVLDAVFKVSNAGSSSGGGGLLSGLFGGLFGGGSQWAGIKSGKITGGLFADGGYTGAASEKAVAGVVHGGEYVFSKKATDRIGVGNLEAMHRSAKGYAVGGFVGSAATSMPANNNVQAGGQSVVLIQLSPELVGQILQQAQGQTVKIVQQNEKNKQNLQQNGQAQNG